MKRFLKWALIGLGTLAILAVVLPLGFLFAPAAIQTSVVRLVASGNIDGDVQLESIRIRPSGVTVRGAGLDRGTERITLESAELDARFFGLVSAVIRDETLRIERIEALGLRVILDPDPTDPTEPEPFELPQIGVPDLPFSISIGLIRTEGSIQIQEGPEATFAFELEDFQTSGPSTGQFTARATMDGNQAELSSRLDIDFVDRNFRTLTWHPNLIWTGADGSYSELTDVRFGVEQSSDRLTAGLWLQSDDQPARIEMRLPDDHPLLEELELDLNYQLQGSILLIAGMQGIEIPSFQIEAQSPDGQRFTLESIPHFVWQFEAGPLPDFNWPQGDWVRFAWDAFRVPHPDWDARIDGRLVVSLHDESIRLATDQPIEVRPNFSLPFIDLHRLQLEVDGEAGLDGKPTALQLLASSEVNRMGDDPDPFTLRLSALLEPQADQSLRWNFTFSELSQFEPPRLYFESKGTVSPDRDLEAQAEYRLIPERWTQRLQLEAIPVEAIKGYMDLNVAFQETIRTRFQIESQVHADEDIWPEPVQLQAHGAADLDDTRLSLGQFQTQLHNGENQLLARIALEPFDLDLDQITTSLPQISGKGEFTHALFRLLEPQLPGLAKNYRYLNLQFDAGIESGNLGLHLAPLDSAPAAVDLRAHFNYEHSLEAEASGSEKLNAQASLQLNDETIESQLRYLLGAQRDRIEINVGWIELDALMALQESLLPADAESTPDPETSGDGPEAIEWVGGAFWQAWILTDAEELEIETQLEGIRSSGQVILNGLTNRIVITSDSLEIEPTHFQLVEAPTRLEGVIRYDAEASEIYQARFAFNSEGLDTSKLARAAQARSDRHLETRLNINGQFSSSANALEDLFWQGESSFSLESGSGIIRLINPDEPSPAQDLAGAVGRLVLGRLSPQLAVIPDIYDQLNNLDFDSLTLQASSRPGGDISFDRIELIAPQLRMAGGGQLRLDREQGFQILQQPLNLSFRLGAKGRLGELFNTIGLLRSSADADGFRALNREIRVGGTLAQPDMSDLWNMILRR